MQVVAAGDLRAACASADPAPRAFCFGFASASLTSIYSLRQTDKFADIACPEDATLTGVVDEAMARLAEQPTDADAYVVVVEAVSANHPCPAPSTAAAPQKESE